MSVGGLIAAAGEGRRAGGPKAVRIGPDDVRTYLDRAIAALRAWGCEPVVAVVRPEHETIAKKLGALAVVPDPVPQAMIDSLRAGLARLASDPAVNGVVWAPVDCPGAMEAFARFAPAPSALEASVPVVGGHQGKGGHPVFLPRGLWYRLDLPVADLEGARAVLTDCIVVEIAPASLENRNT